MNKLKKNKRGSAILWAMIIGMVLLVIVTATLSYSYAYSKRSLNGNAENQAYFTARSTLDTVVSEFLSNSKKAQTMYTYLVTAKTWSTADVGLSKSQMGKCSLSMSLDKKTLLTIYATAKKNGETYKIGATLVGIPDPSKLPPSPPLLPGEIAPPAPPPGFIDPLSLEWYVKSFFKDSSANGGA